MIYIFRVLLLFSVLYVTILLIMDSAAGMKLVWIGIILGCSLLSIDKFYGFFFSIRGFKVMFITLVSIFTIIESLIIITGFNTSIDAKADYIIVLGARVKGEIPSLTLKYRLDKALEYLNKNQEVIAVLSGGQGADENMSEAEAMKRYLIEKGIKGERLILEDKSKSTYENLTNSFDIINKYNKEAKLIVVTNRFHILRSKMIAADLGRKVDALGANTMQILIPNYYLREFFAVVKEILS